MAGGEVTEAVGFARSVVSKVSDVITRHRTMKGAVKNGLNYIFREMKMMISEIEVHEKKQGATHEGKIVLLKELAYDIEDFIDLTWVPGASGLVFTAIGMDPRAQILQRIDYFKDSIQSVRNWQPDAGSGDGGDGGAATTWSFRSAASPHHPCSAEAATLMGICKRRDELGRLLAAAESEDLKVISIVGCHGVGKTTLARAVYVQCLSSGEYDSVAWVVASACCGPEDLLRKVVKEAHETAAQTSCGAPEGSLSDAEQTSLRSFLRGKRYFVVIDDVDRPEVWQAIKNEFPEEGHSSRIIVTTSVHSVAAECSWGSYVYTMQCLGKDESEEVFWKTISQEIPSPALQGALEAILKKCGGLPLALISVANYLRRQGRAERGVAGGLKIEHCKAAARALGHKIAGQDSEFSEIHRALHQCYNNLPNYVHRSCLLYVSVFPRDRLINCKALLRRWMAEGLVGSHGTVNDEEGAKGCLEEFIDRCIIEPVEINNARVAMCRVHSVMLEFIIHKAVSRNFVALVYKDELLCNKGTIDVRVRRLSVQESSKKGVEDAAKDIDLSVMRSLTLFGCPLLDLQDCKLLRVLDLEGCKGFNNGTGLRAICKQRFLKYLSLRGTDVAHLPPEIRCLDRLETLDIRDTGVGVLPIQVIKLPLLAHLFGRFKLAPGIKRDMSKQSSLQTLAGVVVTEVDQSFENIILHAEKLRKVKIYQAVSHSSNSLPSKRMNPCNDSPLLRLKERFIGCKALQILSIDSSDFSTQFLSFLEAPCVIPSIKLRGQLESLPDALTLRQLVNLNKLLLISTGLSSEDLSVLQNLSYLEYLKLAEDHDGFRGGSFIVKSGGFPSLKRLCFEAPKLPEVQFEKGSMMSLTILDLLCPRTRFDLNFHLSHQMCSSKESRIGVAGLAYVENLNQVNLHHSTRESKMRAWKEEAIRHKNRPSVKRQPQPIIYN
ncbi:hypothetical protein ACP70R_008446 [Stipagrostis hirtigluma subsp. patula]